MCIYELRDPSQGTAYREYVTGDVMLITKVYDSSQRSAHGVKQQET